MQVRYFIFGCRFIVSCISTTACDCDPIGCNCVYDTKILKRYCCFYNELGLLLWHSLHFLFCFHCFYYGICQRTKQFSSDSNVVFSSLINQSGFWLFFFAFELVPKYYGIFWRRYSVFFVGMVHAHFTYGFIGMTNTCNDRNREMQLLWLIHTYYNRIGLHRHHHLLMATASKWWITFLFALAENNTALSPCNMDETRGKRTYNSIVVVNYI
jgi:hypothetical protein